MSKRRRAFAICRSGLGFSIEERATGNQVSWHASPKAAVKAWLRITRKRRRD